MVSQFRCRRSYVYLLRSTTSINRTKIEYRSLKRWKKIINRNVIEKCLRRTWERLRHFVVSCEWQLNACGTKGPLTIIAITRKNQLIYVSLPGSIDPRLIIRWPLEIPFALFSSFPFFLFPCKEPLSSQDREVER